MKCKAEKIPNRKECMKRSGRNERELKKAWKRKEPRGYQGENIDANE